MRSNGSTSQAALGGKLVLRISPAEDEGFVAMVSVQLDDDLFAAMRLADEPLDRLARESIVLELYRRKSISSGKAAALLGMARFDFVRYASRLGIPYFDMTKEEWDAEMSRINELTSA